MLIHGIGNQNTQTATATMDSNLVLAGGGHAHILLLKRWAMNPHLRPKGLITLVSNNSYTFYSGMLPGYFAGIYGIFLFHESDRKFSDIV